MNKLFALFKRFYIIMFFVGGISIITIDQFMKYKIRNFGGSYICNSGIALGITISPIVFWLIFVIFLLLGLTYFSYLFKKSALKHFLILAFVLILAGMVSNVADRLLFGCVFDYIFLSPKKIPVFNVADIAIFMGGLLLIFNSPKQKQP